MKIGIDLDDTLCETTELIAMYAEQYANRKQITVSDIYATIEEKMKFFEECLPLVYAQAKVKEGAREAIGSFRLKGIQVYIITARSDNFVPSLPSVKPVIETWLKKQGIVVDGIFCNAYGASKGKVCLKEKISWMIDDNLYNYQSMASFDVSILLFDDENRYPEISNRVTSWKELQLLIEKV